MADVNANMARFMEAKERAKKLIQMDASGALNKYGKDKINEFRNSYDTVNDTFAESIIPENIHNTQRDYSQIPINNSKLSQSKLPAEILESFKKKQISTDAFSVDVGQTSVLDLLGENSINQQKTVQTPKKQQIISENTNNTPTNTNIDYSLIKTIVEDTIKRYSSALKKSIINESKNIIQEDNTMQAMKIGNKFTFISKNGDLYEATLKKIGNINEKKSK